MAESFSLKDQLINADKVGLLAGWLAPVVPGFDADAFHRDVMARLLELELKARISWIAEVMGRHLPDDFETSAALIHQALPPALDPTLTDDDFGDFIIDPFGQYVVTHGIDRLDLSVPLLHALTQRFSMEFAIRPFLIRHKDHMLGVLKDWSRDEVYHVRRLASEGSRPLVPWGERIRWAVSDAIPILDQLYADPTRYVTRSVANHLNDIAKSDPDLVVSTLRRWQDEGRQEAKEMAWMTRHACRTLVKQGHAGALELLGFRADAKVNVGPIAITPADGPVAIDTKLEFAFDVTAERDEALIIDYVIQFQRSGGKLSDKVFKIKQVSLKTGQTLRISKAHPFKGNATTFRLYPGAHQLTVQINGQPMGTVGFELV